MNDTIDLNVLAEVSPEFRVARKMADEHDLTSVTIVKAQRGRGFVVKIIFRGPNHRRGDEEIIFRVCARPKKLRRERG